MNWIANGILRAVGVDPEGRGDQRLHPRRGRRPRRGVAARGPAGPARGAPAGRRAEVRGARRPLGPAAHRRSWRPSARSHARRARAGRRADGLLSRFPVARDGRLDRLPAPQGRPRVQGRPPQPADRRVVDPPAARGPAPPTACASVLATMQRSGAHLARVTDARTAGRSASWRSRTCSRSSSARSATRRARCAAAAAGACAWRPAGAASRAPARPAAGARARSARRPRRTPGPRACPRGTRRRRPCRSGRGRRG